MSFLKSNKVLNHPEKYKEWYDKNDTNGPITVKIDLTNVCNHDCPGCIDYELIHNDNNSLNFNLFNDLLDSLVACGVRGINYTGGGEPTTHKQFDKIIRLTHKKGFKIGLICNGSRFHRWPMEELLPMFEWIRVSLDAYDAETHVRTHGRTAKFDLTVKNLKLLADIKKKNKLSVTLGAGYITNQHDDMDRNLHKFIEVCKDAGIDYAQLRPSFGFLYDYKSVSGEELKKIFAKAKSYQSESFKVIIDEGKYEKILAGKGTCRTYNYCHAQSFKATTITATGDVYVCCSLTGVKEGWLGNIKFKNFFEIWNSDFRKKVLNKLDVNKCPHLCVGDNLNEFLDKIKVVTHKDFL
jgi:MoaA/NifB/PqqE/SkfB family radical SAM enzyme